MRFEIQKVKQSNKCMHKDGCVKEAFWLVDKRISLCDMHMNHFCKAIGKNFRSIKRGWAKHEARLLRKK